MSKEKSVQRFEFEAIVQLINDARNRAFSKVNEELELLYFNVCEIVSSKVAEGMWGEGTIDVLANHIAVKLPGMNGFNRRVGCWPYKGTYERSRTTGTCFRKSGHIRSHS